MRTTTLRMMVLSCALTAMVVDPVLASTRQARGRKAPDSPPAPPPAVALEVLDDCDGLREYVSEVILETVVQSRYGRGWWRNPWSGPGDTVGGGGEPADFTSTNVQEDGVDELDIVKTDGSFVYTVQDQEFLVVDSWPAQSSEIVARLPLTGSPSGLFLFGDLAVVVSSFWHDGELDPRYGAATRVELIDLSDRSAPRIVRALEVEGYLSGARLVDGQAYLVLSTYMAIPNEAWGLVWRDDVGLPEVPWDAPEDERAAAAELARGILRPLVDELVWRMPLAELVPASWDSADGPSARVKPLLGCGDLYRPVEGSSYSVLSVLHLDLNAAEPVGGTLEVSGVLSSGWTVYASAHSLYVAQSSMWWWAAADELTTTIHAFDLGRGATAQLSYVASGAVPGWLFNSFSMGEHEGYLRVATTLFDWWWGSADDPARELGTQVTVLADNGQGELAVVGSVAGIAPGEQLYAARFMGDRGYLVTFERVDPLFTLDLSLPEAPRVVGELKVPGFSSYLHPMEGGRLLAVGMDGEEDGTITGLAVSVFDVSDLAEPQQVHQYRIESGAGQWSWSEALWDHHAFTFHRGVLSIPVHLSDGFDHFSGLVVLAVDPTDGISELGRVNHNDLPARPDGWDDWVVSMRRSLYIEEYLYSLSVRGLKVNLLADPQITVAVVPFY